MMWNNTLVWTIMLLFTLTGYFLSGGGALLQAIVLTLFAVKFFLIDYQFMELRRAHPFWRYALNTLLACFISVILFTIVR